jgi:hypothetical protein
MSHRSSHQDPGPSRKFVPDVNPLENRFLLMCGPPLGGHELLCGIAVQTGTVLSISVNMPTTNTVQVTDDGAGDVQADWNGGAVHSFNGVDTVHVHTEKARNVHVTFSLIGPSTITPDVAVRPHRQTDTATAHEGGDRVFRVATPRKHGGIAVQSGTVLTVTVNRPRTNTVQITDVGAGNIQVAWNGGSGHSFTGVATIVVDARKARNDHVTFTESAR